MAKQYLGIDVSKGTLDVALYKGKHGRFNNSRTGLQALDRWLEKAGVDELHACMEATGRYWVEIAVWLHSRDHRVSVVNPNRTSSYARSKLIRSKTDAVDAHLIADFCRTQAPKIWTPPREEQHQLRDLVRRYGDIQKMERMEKNRLKCGVKESWVVTDLEHHLAYLKERREQLEQEIEVHITAHPWLSDQYKLLVTIPGIAAITASRLLGEITDIASFESAKKLAAFAGLTPRHHTSGSSINRHTTITKTGNAHLREALYWPAISAQEYLPAVRALRERMLANGKSKMATIVAAMRKLLHIVYGVIKSMKPFNPELGMPVNNQT